MAYADARHTQRNVSTAALVAVLEVALGLGIIAGLSFTIAPPKVPPNPVANTFELDPPKPKDPPKPAIATPRVIDTQTIIRDPVIDLGPAPAASYAAEDIGGGEGLGVVAFPTPTPSPAPSFTAIKARPRGNPAGWVTENDYPTIAIRGEQQGRTSFRLSLDAAGKVTNCTVTTSSGWPLLDAATCEKLTRRARFDAAVDNTGVKVAGSYTGTVNWRLPED
jgi:periplasmic protein TonB